MRRMEQDYIQGFLAGISYVMRTTGQGGHKVAELPYSWVEMQQAGVPEQHVRRLREFLEQP